MIVFIKRLIRFSLRFFIKIILMVTGLVFMLSLLAAALVVMVLALVKLLLTGKKPEPAVVFNRFKSFSPQGIWPGSDNARTTAPGHGEVVDVVAREVKPDAQRLP